MPRMAAYDRQDCLEKAVTLFWEKGFHATSLKDIEHALDMRPGSIYAAFGNKESLYSQALDLYAGTMGKDFLDNLRGQQTPIEGLAEYLRELGKLRDTITVAKGTPRDELERLALAAPKVARILDGASPKKVIVVPDRLVNIVT